MIGIVSHGGYIPRPRLDRMAIYQSMGWFAPATLMVAQGERSFCNWDEDSLTMAVAAARDCLTGFNKRNLAGVYFATTTPPFADRSPAGTLKAALNLNDAIVTADFALSQRAGTSALVAALNAAAGGASPLLVVAADRRETKAATFHEMWFGDGAAALIVGGENVIAEFAGAYSVAYDFVDHYRGAQKMYDYFWEERWVRDEGYTKIIPEAVTGLLRKLSLTMEDVDKLIFPCYFSAEHRKIAKSLGAADRLASNLHEVCGETGTAHPLVMLDLALQDAKPGDRLLLAGFGQGADALYFRVTDAIKSLPARPGVKGSLARKETVEVYTKYLKFRELIETGVGIRGEAPTQTAMTVLWRKRKMLLGLVGGRCRACGTPQIPSLDICVNPECLALDSQDEYEFADLPATVKTFTGDMLAVSADPPAIYGMVQFEGGGRMLADFTDCKLDDVYVGQPVTLAFRRRMTDKERGFAGYFWKAIPCGAKAAPDDATPKAARPGVAEVFELMKAGFRADKAAGVDVVFQYYISGEGGGTWQLTVRDGKADLQTGEHPSPTTTLRMSAEDFVAISLGELNAMAAFSSGKLKIEGDMMKSQLLGKLFKL